MLRFSRYWVSGDTWHDHVDATWHPKEVTHGMIHVVHLCEWLTLSHVSMRKLWKKQIHENKEKKK